MKILEDITEDQVFHAWIKSEFDRVTDWTTDEIVAIKNPMIGNSDQSLKRKGILFNRLGRSAILNHLPKDIKWKKIELEKSDIDNIYVIPVYDLFLDTGRTFKLNDVPANLSPARNYKSPFIPPPKTHHEKINSIITGNNIEGELVMVSSSLENGKLTIIDGVHRGSALLINKKLIGRIIYVGVSSGIKSWVWSVEDENFQNKVRELNRAINIGLIS